MILERVNTGSKDAIIAQMILASSDCLITCVAVVDEGIQRYDFYEQGIDDYLLGCNWKGEVLWNGLEKLLLCLVGLSTRLAEFALRLLAFIWSFGFAFSVLTEGTNS